MGTIRCLIQRLPNACKCVSPRRACSLAESTILEKLHNVLLVLRTAEGTTHCCTSTLHYTVVEVVVGRASTPCCCCFSGAWKRLHLGRISSRLAALLPEDVEGMCRSAIAASPNFETLLLLLLLTETAASTEAFFPSGGEREGNFCV